ncbi:MULTISPECIES: pantetheine-phosphate adenylyltransferase [unclassified Campylobacter]|uniref:pantetheine-phosphate adenylyltransferase n=1 Tax=unclassified Campylobacter TaxID=2593542 RepID=UPI001B557EB5|nr:MULTISPECIES: pantetheine-phosphate adenylyltransferase [unclassified Campylobacter]MBP3223857.1 pantetheine-phosphate adenylyltransferase [Campylobacter sp.]MDA3054048.1 pantetheine-phosphate adenylyltransferase [Campylobacter sp. VBCF_07 NA4]MDA3060065.1 pantetheine-phosphate adenylyltransferase [Campylobacter sp. VBCF_02 NA5]MDA3061563.1 pantetheine-phosphate adenylyltransferase [Campylobacter sp. JMF_14 EL1]MDA3069579.1 pantetheine-phosphate adenylyltransferase [Campylobacter sp. VBCF_0
MRKCIYPGTFDPITNGHLDVIKRALGLFDEVVVAIALSESKSPCFSLEKRLEMTRLALSDLKNVKVEPFSNLLVDFAKSHGTNFCIRGLRAVSDFEYELQLSYTNTSLWNKFESVFLMPSLKNAFISSSMVRTILRHDGDVSQFVPKQILPLLKKEN